MSRQLKDKFKLFSLVTWITVMVVGLAGCESGSRVETVLKRPHVIIDVRTKGERDLGFIEGSIHIPYDTISSKIQSLNIEKDNAIILYCRSGGRAGVAKAALEKLGYKTVVNAGGYGDLKNKISTPRESI